MELISMTQLSRYGDQYLSLFIDREIIRNKKSYVDI